MLSRKNCPFAAFSSLIIGMLFSSIALPLHAQYLDDLQSIRAGTSEFKTASPLGAFPPSEGRRTYWLEGGAVGGLALGAIGYSLGSACPPNTGSCPSGAVGFLIGASVGFVIGAFIGDTIEKK
jgi:hypothetical protein